MGPDSNSLSPEEIVVRITEAARNLRSLRRDMKVTVTSRQGERSSSAVWLQVGGEYASWDPSEASDHSTDLMIYRGLLWRRDTTARWVLNMPPGREPLDLRSTDLSWGGMSDGQRMMLVVGVDLDRQVDELHRLADDENEGQGSPIHLHGRYGREVSFLSSTLWPDQVEPGEGDASADVETDGTIDLWVDPDTFYVIRTEEVLTPVEASYDVGTEAEAVMRVTMTFSHFNEAELPGPLPE